MADDIARLGYEIDSTQALSAARNLLTMEQAAGRAAIGTASLTDRFRDARGRFISTSRAASSHAREIADLAGKYNLALSAELRFAEAQREVARAVQLGVLSADQADAALERLQAQYTSTGSAAVLAGNRIAGSATNMQGTVGNQFAQLNDVVVTAWGGMNPALIGIQQGMQMVQGFAGQSVPQALGTLRGAFMTLLSPTTLLTVGLVAGGAALIQWASSAIGATNETAKFSDSIDSLESITSDANRAIDVLEMNAIELARQYGVNAQRVRELAVAELELAVARQRATLSESSARDATLDAISSYTQLTRVVGENGEIYNDYSAAIRAVRAEFGVTGSEASRLVDRFNAVRNAATVDDQVQAWTELHAALDQSGIELTQLPGPLAEALVQMLALEGATIDLNSALGRAVDTGVALAGVLGNRPSGQRGRGGRRGRGTGITSLRLPDDDDPPGTGGGGGQSEAERLAEAYKQRLDALRASLLTEREVIDDWYETNLADLNDRRAAELLGVEQHNEMRLALEREYQERLIALRGSYQGTGVEQTQKFMGDMASALQGGNDRMQRIASVFAGIEATINAYRAFNQVLADPSLPWFAKIPAAVSVLAAGLRTVQAIKGGGSGGSGVSSGGGISGSTVSQNTDRRILVTFDGPDWAKDMFENWTDQIFDAAGDGKVIFR